MKNKLKLKKYINVIAIGLVMVLSVSALVAIVFSIDSSNPVQNSGDKLTTCDVYGHNWVDEPGTPVKCTTNGTTNFVYCSICKAVERNREVIQALGHHEPQLYDNGLVQCRNCNCDMGSDYFTINNFNELSNKKFDESILVTLEGVVVTKGCDSNGSVYSLFICGDSAVNAYRVDFNNARLLEPFNVGDKIVVTGTYVLSSKSGDRLTNVQGYTILSRDNTFLLDRTEAYYFSALSTGYDNFANDYYANSLKLVYVYRPICQLSAKTGVVANNVRFTGSACETSFVHNEYYFAFSMRYLKEFTNHVGQAGTVTFNDVLVRAKDKPITSNIRTDIYCYLAYWGETTLQFVIVDEVYL